MKKVLIVVALAVALTFAITVVAFADHSPSFYIQWNEEGGFEGANAFVTSPHAGYVEGTQKCGVCHAVHRAAVQGLGWEPGGQLYPAEIGGENRAARLQYSAPFLGETQMLLQTPVSGNCDYCHITTSIGAIQIYAGKVKYRLEANDANGGSNWEGGFAHNNACTACHAVHGAFANPFVAAPTAADNVVFQGPLAAKVVKGYAKNKSTTWQREIYLAGTNYESSLFPGVQPVVSSAVDPLNTPLFASKADALAGTNARVGADVADAQVSAHCTFCHENYGYAAEAMNNREFFGKTVAEVAAITGTNNQLESYKQGAGLFQGQWNIRLVADGPQISARNAYSTTPTGGTAPWLGPGFDGHVAVKNHPMKRAVTTGWSSAGGAAIAQVAFKGSDTCRSCHDAGVEGAGGVIIQSFPHFTPGYFKFLISADNLGAEMMNINAILKANPRAMTQGVLDTVWATLDDPAVQEAAECTSDGACLKCHINADKSAGIGLTF